MQALTQHTGGMALVWLITVGLIGYALWRFSEAAFGVASEGARLGRDCESFARELIYLFLAITAVRWPQA